MFRIIVRTSFSDFPYDLPADSAITKVLTLSLLRRLYGGELRRFILRTTPLKEINSLLVSVIKERREAVVE